MELHQQPSFVDQNDRIFLDNIGASRLPHFRPQEFCDHKKPDGFERLIKFSNIEINIAIIQNQTRASWEQVQIALQALAEPIGIIAHSKAVIPTQTT